MTPQRNERTNTATTATTTDSLIMAEKKSIPNMNKRIYFGLFLQTLSKYTIIIIAINYKSLGSECSFRLSLYGQHT